jgi:DNA-binding response OmpR family regulator
LNKNSSKSISSSILSTIHQVTMKVLICESEEVLLAAIEFRLRKKGYEVAYCKKANQLSEQMHKEDPDMAIIDFDLGKKTGLDMIKTVKEIKPQTGILLLVEPDEEEQIMEAFGLGVNDFISKPFKPSELLVRIRRIAEL